jgi:hypothetical protein
MTDKDEEIARSSQSGSRITEHSASRRDVSWTNRQALKIVGPVLLAWLVFLGVTGDYVIFAIFGVLALLFAAAIGRYFFMSRHRHSEQLYWRGHVSFSEDDFDNRNLFPLITRTQRPSVGRQGLTGGRLEIRRDGLHWRTGTWTTPRSQLSGEFSLPWSVVDSVDVSDIPLKIRFLGGAVTFSIQEDDEELYGEFIGTRSSLLDAFHRTPLAHERLGQQRAIPSGPLTGTLSDDGNQFWNGTEWISTTSVDGRFRWDGSQWVGIAGGASSDRG